VEGGVHVTLGEASPRSQSYTRARLDDLPIAPHTKFQMQRRCSGGDRSESHPP